MVRQEGSGRDPTLASGPSIEAVRGEAAIGAKIGRYLLLGELGAGGMGVVYVALDLELDRKVALKVLRTNAADPEATAGRTRLLREAQAMAKLRHPNVVAIHDVGQQDGAVYLAMELVEGGTLLQWSRARTRGWSEVLDVLVQAGRGLAAAHAKDLVHRDFKPDNVMVADDGRVLVMDFGLARTHGEPSERALAQLPASSPVDLLATPLTQAGAVIGTPAYMAPEQLLGLDADARSDQFSFCVTLHEMLHGERPYQGTAARFSLGAAPRARDRPAPRARVPRWLRRACGRGLSPSREDRFASMDDLLHALETGRVQSRRLRVAAALGAVGLVAACSFGWHRLDVQARVDACATTAQSIAVVWDDARRQRVVDAFVETGVAAADMTAAKVAPWLDAWSGAWSRTRETTCLAADVDRALTSDQSARADACLDERRMRFEALVGQLERPDPGTVRHAVAAAASLPLVEPCGEVHELGRSPMWPPGSDEEAKDIVRVLATATAQFDAGRYDDALATAEDAVVRAETLGFGPLEADAKRVAGRVQSRRGTYETAEALLADAYQQATTSGASAVAVDAATSLVHVVGIERAHHGEALVWARVAEAAVTVLEPEPGLRTARLLDAVAGVQHALGEYRTALATRERGIAILERELGSQHPDLAASLSGLAATRRSLGEFAEALALHERALAIRERAFGSEHPEVASSLTALSVVDLELGEFGRAIERLERALALLERALGPEHPDVAEVLSSLAAARRSTGDLDRAPPLYRRALEIRRHALGNEHPDVARSLNDVATTHHAKGEYAEAKVAFEEAIAIWEAAMGPSHPEVGALLVNLAKLYEVEEDHARAQELYERALAIRREALGPNHPRLAYVFVGLGNVALARGRPAEAVAHAQRAVDLRAEAPPPLLGEAVFLLAQAMWDAPGGDPARAREHAERAATIFRDAEGMDDALSVVQAWLDTHALPSTTAPG